MSSKILSCDLHDYLEIACMFHYQVEVLTIENEVITGIAKDVKTLPDKKEVLILQSEHPQTALIEIRVTSMKHLKVLTPGARFEQVSFE